MLLLDVLADYQKLLDLFDVCSFAEKYACLSFAFQLMGILSRYEVMYSSEFTMLNNIESSPYFAIENVMQDDDDENKRLVIKKFCHIRFNGEHQPLYEFKVKSDGVIDYRKWYDSHCFFAWCRFNMSVLEHFVPDSVSYSDFVKALYSMRNNLVHEGFIGLRYSDKMSNKLKVIFVDCDQVTSVMNFRCYVSIAGFCKSIFEVAQSSFQMCNKAKCSDCVSLGVSSLEYDKMSFIVRQCYSTFWQKHDLELYRIWHRLYDSHYWESIVKHFGKSDDAYVVNYFNWYWNYEADDKRFLKGPKIRNDYENVQLYLTKKDFNKMQTLIRQVCNYENTVIRDTLLQEGIKHF